MKMGNLLLLVGFTLFASSLMGYTALMSKRQSGVDININTPGSEGPIELPYKEPDVNPVVPLPLAMFRPQPIASPQAMIGWPKPPESSVAPMANRWIQPGFVNRAYYGHSIPLSEMYSNPSDDTGYGESPMMLAFNYKKKVMMNVEIISSDWKTYRQTRKYLDKLVRISRFTDEEKKNSIFETVNESDIHMVHIVAYIMATLPFREEKLESTLFYNGKKLNVKLRDIVETAKKHVKLKPDYFFEFLLNTKLSEIEENLESGELSKQDLSVFIFKMLIQKITGKKIFGRFDQTLLSVKCLSLLKFPNYNLSNFDEDGIIIKTRDIFNKPTEERVNLQTFCLMIFSMWCMDFGLLNKQ